MTEPYVGEIRMFGFQFAPTDWAFCQGQLMRIAENQALYSLLGSTFGGDGTTTFKLPDLRGRVPFGVGSFPRGTKAGTEQVVLQEEQLPAHTHTFHGYSAPQNPTADPATARLADPGEDIYSGSKPAVGMAPGSIGGTGNNQPHSNLQPSLVVNFCIALQGHYPPHS